MSNARSPREVCSTTMGTSGLMFLASFACAAGFLPNVATALCGRSGITTGRTPGSERARPSSAAGGSAPGRPKTSSARAGRLRVFLAGCPQLLSRLRLLDADRLGLADEQLERLAGRDVLAHAVEPPVRAQIFEQLLDLGASALGARLERV